MAQQTTAPPQQSAGVGGILRRKIGPLPVIAWLGILLALIVLVLQWRRNRQGSASATAPDTATAPDLQQNPIFIVPQAAPPTIQVQPAAVNPSPVTVPVTVTVPAAPPGGGRDVPPGTTPHPAPAPPGKYVPVVKYTTKNPPWNSTLSGIAGHYHIASWQTVWNDPLNADLRKKRGKPERIQPGDQVFVRGAR